MSKHKKFKRLKSKELRKGMTCPCCGQFAKIYKRRLDSSMVNGLRTMFECFGRQPFSVNDLLASSREAGKLAYWHLVDAGETRGTWRVSPLGEKFLHGEASVSSHVEVYNGTPLRMVGPSVFADEIVEGFNYAELMAA